MSMTYIIPDIHGRLDLLSNALDVISHIAPAAKIIFLGDYIDRGPQSAEVIATVRGGVEGGKPWIALKGNHEVDDQDRYFAVHRARPVHTDRGAVGAWFGVGHGA